MSTPRWTTNDMPDQTGKTIIVTGANSGLGAATASALAAHGADVILACRNVRKGEAAAAKMSGRVSVRRLDLGDLASIREFADGIEHVDVLINNAGVMAVPKGRTSDGFENQMGTNFLGHFALTGLLLPKITERVVTLSSLAHWGGFISLDDSNWNRRTYRRWSAYGQSKLADLMFAYELHRRLTATGSSVRSLAAHPGVSRTELHTHTDPVEGAMIATMARVLGQSGEMGALPSLRAATAPDARGGEFYGPGNPTEMRGYPELSVSSRKSRDTDLAAALWDRASELTGVEFLSPAPHGSSSVEVGGGFRDSLKRYEGASASPALIAGLALLAVTAFYLAAKRARRR